MLERDKAKCKILTIHHTAEKGRTWSAFMTIPVQKIQQECWASEQHMQSRPGLLLRNRGAGLSFHKEEVFQLTDTLNSLPLPSLFTAPSPAWCPQIPRANLEWGRVLDIYHLCFPRCTLVSFWEITPPPFSASHGQLPTSELQKCAHDPILGLFVTILRKQIHF